MTIVKGLFVNYKMVYNAVLTSYTMANLKTNYTKNVNKVIEIQVVNTLFEFN